MISRYERLSTVVAEISRLISKISADVMREHGLRGSWARYLLAMRKYSQPITAARLCKLCGRDKADASRFVTELEERGLVEKATLGNYRVRMQLTAEGVRIADAIAERVGTMVNYVGGDLSDEARSSLYESLDNIAARLKLLSDGGYSTI